MGHLAASLAMEIDSPAGARGLGRASCNAAIPSGFLLAAIAYGLIYGRTFGGLYDRLAGDVPVSVLPGLRRAFIRSSVPESPAFEASRAHERPHLWATLEPAPRASSSTWSLLVFCFNLFSHRAQDLYPTFLQKQPLTSIPERWSLIAVVADLGAIAGGLAFGHRSEKIGRVDAITIASLDRAAAAVRLIGLRLDARPPGARRPSSSRSAVQGAMEQSRPISTNCRQARRAPPFRPSSIRPATSSPTYNAPLQAKIAEGDGGDYGLALAIVAAVVAVVIVVVIRFSPERRRQLLTAH